MQPFEPLQNLRDIHLPAPISMWPLAPGWWILFLLCIFLFVGVFIFGKKLLIHRLRKLAILKQVEKLSMIFHNNPAYAMQELSVLLKRVVLLNFPKENIAALKGEEWLLFLDKTGKTNVFKNGVGRHFLTAPYQSKPEVDFEELCRIVKCWLQRVL